MDFLQAIDCTQMSKRGDLALCYQRRLSRPKDWNLDCKGKRYNFKISVNCRIQVAQRLQIHFVQSGVQDHSKWQMNRHDGQKNYQIMNMANKREAQSWSCP